MLIPALVVLGVFVMQFFCLKVAFLVGHSAALLVEDESLLEDELRHERRMILSLASVATAVGCTGIFLLVGPGILTLGAAHLAFAGYLAFLLSIVVDLLFFAGQLIRA